MNLKAQAFRGGVYLVFRQGIGILIGFVGVLLLTRAIGPSQYGLYAASLGIFTYLQTVTQLGVSVYLVRQQEEKRLEVYHQAFSILLSMGIAGATIATLCLPIIKNWIQLDGFESIAQVMFWGLPISLIYQVPLAILERNLNYRRIATIELWNQVFYYLVALPLAFGGKGAWAPVIGWWAMQLQYLALFFWSANYRPKFYWRLDLLKEMLGYSVGFSASIWVWQLRSLVNPLLVGRYAGAEGVGYVALAIRLVELLSFVKTTTWRIGIATLSRLQNDKSRLLSAVSEGMQLQILAIGPLLSCFSLIAPFIMPRLFGDSWSDVLQVYPFIAFSYLTNSLFNLHSSALYVLQRNWEVTIFHAAHIIIFFFFNLLLLPKLGLVGYGFAEVIAVLSYIVIHIYLVKFVGKPDYSLAFLWWAAFALSLFVNQLGWWAMTGILIVSLLPITHQRLMAYWKLLGSSEWLKKKIS